MICRKRVIGTYAARELQITTFFPLTYIHIPEKLISANTYSLFLAMPEYKFRAECIADVANLMNVKEFARIIMSIQITSDSLGLPDVDVCMTTANRYDLNSVRNIISTAKVPDTHVILESINYAHEYTGYRYYYDNV